MLTRKEEEGKKRNCFFFFLLPAGLVTPFFLLASTSIRCSLSSLRKVHGIIATG